MDQNDIIYYNVDIIDNKVVDDQNDPDAKYHETRDQPLVKNVGDYLFSITRFNMNGTGKSQSIPIFLPTIEVDTTRNPTQNPNQTIYKITIGVNYDISGTAGYVEETLPMIFEPQNLEIPIPQIYQGKQDVGNPYYFVYTYDHVVKMFNKTIEDIFQLLDLHVFTATGKHLATREPFMRYNSANGKFEMYYDHNGFGENPTSTGTADEEIFHINFNANMYGLFSNYPNTYTGGDVADSSITAENDQAYQILPMYEMGIHDVVLGGYTYFMNTQEFVSTDSLWSPISSLVFVSLLIPVVNENVGQPISYGVGNSTDSVTTRSLKQPIITDIALTNQFAHDYKQYIAYYPAAQYRLTNLIGKQDLRSIDIQVYWKNRLDNQLYPVKLFNLSSISVKIMFIKKTFYEKK